MEDNYDTEIRSIKMLFLRINKQLHIFKKFFSFVHLCSEETFLKFGIIWKSKKAGCF